MRTDSKERPFEVDVNENGYVEVWAEGEWVMDFDWTGDPEDHSAIQEEIEERGREPGLPSCLSYEPVGTLGRR